VTRGEKVRIGRQIVLARVTGRPRPFFVQYALLNACNAACVYCNCPRRADPRMPVDRHREVLREFARLGAVRIKFLGGEPLLSPDLDALIDEVRALGMRAAMVTNGFLVPKRMDLVRRLDEVVISLDGREHAHDAQRGRGTWAKVMAAIEACSSAGIDFFISAVVTRQSLDEIDWLLATARQYHVMVNFQLPQFNPEMYGTGAREWLPNTEDIAQVVTRIITAKESGAPVLFSTRSYRRTLEWPDFSIERIERPGQPSPCTAGRYFLQFEPNGDVYPCVLHIGGAFRPKNAFRDGVEAAWRHASSHSCVSCYNTWLNENRAIFDLHPSVLRNFWVNYMRTRTGYE
jgi:MoaA/NifB/PqqE/SkfB family radical SAM enzyme